MDTCETLYDARLLARFARSVRVAARIVKTTGGYVVLYRAA